MIVTANKLWYNGELAQGMCPASINCDLLVGITPRDAFLTPMAGGSCCGGGSYCGDPMYNLSLSRPVPYPAGTLQGVWLEFRGGFGMMVDALSAQDVVDSCNDCCGAVAAIVPRYNGVLPSPPPPVSATYTFTRPDNGDWYAYNRASLQYYGEYIPGTFNRTSYNSSTGVSTYSFNSYGIPVFISGDTAGTLPNRVFTSNTAPTLTGSNIYNIDINVKGVDYVAAAGTTLAALKTAIDAVPGVSALGTTAVVGSTITLTSPSTTQAVLTIGQQAP